LPAPALCTSHPILPRPGV